MIGPAIIAKIRPGSPRAKLWLDVFGTDELRVTSLLPQRGAFNGQEKLFYQCDLASLDEIQLKRLIKHVANETGLAFDEVMADLRSSWHGLPILAEDVTVYTDSRLFV